MHPRRIRIVAACLALGFVLSSCEMTVRFSTVLENDGSGRMTIAMLLDSELRSLLDSFEEGGYEIGMEDLDMLYDGLEAQGWTVTRSDAPDGGLSLEASHAFADQTEFDTLLAGIRTARAGEGGTLDDVGIEFGYATESSLLREGVRFFGRIDTRPGELTPNQQAFQDAVANDLHFEVRALLPGSIRVDGGDATVEDGTVIWRPELGTEMAFAARSSNLRTGALMLVLIPGLLALGAIGWFALGRRRHPVQIADEPVPVPALADELIAIKPDVPIVVTNGAPATNGLPLANGAPVTNGVTAIDLTQTEPATPAEPEPLA